MRLALLSEADAAEVGTREDEPRIMRPLPEDVIERLADLWCEALLANMRRRPILSANHQTLEKNCVMAFSPGGGLD
jgi:hypothetical protein